MLKAGGNEWQAPEPSGMIEGMSWRVPQWLGWDLERYTFGAEQHLSEPSSEFMAHQGMGVELGTFQNNMCSKNKPGWQKPSPEFGVRVALLKQMKLSLGSLVQSSLSKY